MASEGFIPGLRSAMRNRIRTLITELTDRIATITNNPTIHRIIRYLPSPRYSIDNLLTDLEKFYNSFHFLFKLVAEAYHSATFLLALGGFLIMFNIFVFAMMALLGLALLFIPYIAGEFFRAFKDVVQEKRRESMNSRTGINGKAISSSNTPSLSASIVDGCLESESPSLRRAIDMRSEASFAGSFSNELAKLSKANLELWSPQKGRTILVSLELDSETQAGRPKRFLDMVMEMGDEAEWDSLLGA